MDLKLAGTATVVPPMATPLAPDELGRLDAYWRAANYLSVGQIYLLANPLLREPLALEHVKPRLLGHWGTTPGLNFVYAHLNRLIRTRDLNVLYVTGPGHGGPGLVANTYLEGTYSEVAQRVPPANAGQAALGIASRRSPTAWPQEALTNVGKHAAATGVRLELRATASALELRVRDDGRGFEETAAERSGGYGITGMRERAEIGDGSLRVECHECGGTTVALTLPPP